MSTKIEDFGEYSVKNIKSFVGREGYGFNANVYRGKTKVAFAMDDASGGELHIDWLVKSERDILNQHCNKLPLLDTEWNIKLTVGPQLFISELVNKFEKDKEVRKIQRQCETKTLFRASNDVQGSYKTIKSICDDRMRQHLQTKYGNDVEIFNDVFASGRVPSVF